MPVPPCQESSHHGTAHGVQTQASQASQTAQAVQAATRAAARPDSERGGVLGGRVHSGAGKSACGREAGGAHVGRVAALRSAGSTPGRLRTRHAVCSARHASVRDGAATRKIKTGKEERQRQPTADKVVLRVLVQVLVAVPVEAERKVATHAVQGVSTWGLGAIRAGARTVLCQPHTHAYDMCGAERGRRGGRGSGASRGNRGAGQAPGRHEEPRGREAPRRHRGHEGSQPQSPVFYLVGTHPCVSTSWRSEKTNKPSPKWSSVSLFSCPFP